jgi:hypothetical protein
MPSLLMWICLVGIVFAGTEVRERTDAGEKKCPDEITGKKDKGMGIKECFSFC